MSKMHLRITLALLVGLICMPMLRTDFAGSSGVVLAQDSATTPSAQSSPAIRPGREPNIDHPLGPSVLWVKGHPLDMPYRECGDLIERTMWGQQVTITDAPCKAMLAEALRIDRTEPDVEAIPAIDGSRPEDKLPPGIGPDPPTRDEPTQ